MTDEQRQAQQNVTEVRALVDDLQREMERRANLEILLLRTTPEFKAMLREFVDACTASPQRKPRTMLDDARQAIADAHAVVMEEAA